MFNYFTISSFYHTKNFVYLVANKGETIYTYCYDIANKTVRVNEQQGKINERKLPWFTEPYRRLERPFILKNNLIGGTFTVNYRSNGKYWIHVLLPEITDKELNISKIKEEVVIDEAAKQHFLQVLNETDEESNPLLLIGVLKE